MKIITILTVCWCLQCGHADPKNSKPQIPKKLAMNAQDELSIALKPAETGSASEIRIILSSSAKHGWHFSALNLSHGLDFSVLDESGKQVPRNVAGDKLAATDLFHPMRGPKSVDKNRPNTNPLKLGDYFNLVSGHEYRVSVVWKLRVFSSSEEMLNFGREIGQYLELKGGPLVIRIPEK